MMSSNLGSTPPSSLFLVIEPVGRGGSEEVVGVEAILCHFLAASAAQQRN